MGGDDDEADDDDEKEDEGSHTQPLGSRPTTGAPPSLRRS